MPAGRPSTYSAEIVDKAKEYLNTWKDQGRAIPSVVGLCQYIERSKTCVYDWAKEQGKEEFADILARVVEIQELELLDGGLKGEMNSNIVKLALGKHGYHDKQDQNVGGQPGNPVENKWQVEFINPSNPDAEASGKS